MLLGEYYDTLYLLSQGKTVEDIKELTNVLQRDIVKIQQGASIATKILFQVNEFYDRCPACGDRVHLPCLNCQPEDIECIDVVRRPVRNVEAAAQVMLDYDLLEEGDGDDEDAEDDEEGEGF